MGAKLVLVPEVPFAGHGGKVSFILKQLRKGCYIMIHVALMTGDVIGLGIHCLGKRSWSAGVPDRTTIPKLAKGRRDDSHEIQT